MTNVETLLVLAPGRAIKLEEQAAALQVQLLHRRTPTRDASICEYTSARLEPYNAVIYCSGVRGVGDEKNDSNTTRTP